MGLCQFALICASFDGAVACGRLHFRESFFAIEEKAVQVIHIVSRQTRCHRTVWEAQLEKDGLVYTFFKFYGICFRFLCGYPNRFLAYHISRTVNRIYTDIHHGSAAGEVFIQPPLVGVTDPEATLPLKELDCSEFARGAHPYYFHGLRFEMHAIAYE